MSREIGQDKRSRKAHLKLREYFKFCEGRAPQVKQHDKYVSDLIRAVKNDAELALMRGRTSHLGEKHMLLSAIYSSLSQCHRPLQRETAYQIASKALDKYLGIELPPLKLPIRGRKKKRTRRKLLPYE